MRPLLSPHLADLGTTIFAEMSARAGATGSINLGQGFPDTDGPRRVAQEAATAILDGKGNQYPPVRGIPELRRAVAAHQLAWYGIELDPDLQVLVTAGATEAIAAAMLALVDSGDEVIALEPYYDSYAATIAMARGTRVPVTLRPPDFALDPDALRAAITPRTRLLLLNTPHNPTGRVLNKSELATVADIAVEHDLLVVSDEVYEHIVFDGAEHIPICSFPGMADRTVTVGSAGKTFSFTGWKIGWVTGSAELVATVCTTKQFLTFVSGGPFQYAVAEALGSPQGYYDELSREQQAARDLLGAGLTDLGFTAFVPSGTYFLTTDVRPLGWDDGVDFCRDLPDRCGVVAIPHRALYDDPDAGRSLVRWAFCKRPEVLREALDRMRRGGVAR
jgi:N-succinyldiaminopimelate aminotransferase